MQRVDPKLRQQRADMNLHEKLLARHRLPYYLIDVTPTDIYKGKRKGNGKGHINGGKSECTPFEEL